jgi:hypothetical protein
MVDNVQKHNICTNVPSSQTFRSYLDMILDFRLLHEFRDGSSEWCVAGNMSIGFEVYTAVIVQTVFLWNVTAYSFVGGCRHSRGNCCLYFSVEVC